MEIPANSPAFPRRDGVGMARWRFSWPSCGAAVEAKAQDRCVRVRPSCGSSRRCGSTMLPWLLPLAQRQRQGDEEMLSFGRRRRQEAPAFLLVSLARRWRRRRGVVVLLWPSFWLVGDWDMGDALVPCRTFASRALSGAADAAFGTRSDARPQCAARRAFWHQGLLP